MKKALMKEKKVVVLSLNTMFFLQPRRSLLKTILSSKHHLSFVGKLGYN